ncbi:MAG: beta-glucosidase [Pleurocapsa sp. SU_196_0]|nr:beta-glucosidase [Pleurocapsa sp. SU_196_0]
MIGAASALVAANAQTPLPYQNPDLPLETRVADLLSRMSLPEKAGQMVQVNVTRLMGSGPWDRGPLNTGFLEDVLGKAQVGSVLSGGGAAPVPNTPRAWAEMTNALQRFTLSKSRLKIPLLYGADGVHGHNNVPVATMFPHNFGAAAAFDAKLGEQMALSTARAMRATGVRWNFAPDADLGRDPRWGRFYETFGEQPALASSFVAAQVRGFQGGSVAATVKHFVGYGLAPDGRDRAPATVSDTDLRELLLPPFRAAIDAGAMSLMVNSGALNGEPVHASGRLLTNLLRGELKFGGVVISDWDDVANLKTVHRVASSDAEAVQQAVMAGVDVMMVPIEAASTAAVLVKLVEGGQVTRARVDEAVSRVLTLKFKLGLFEQPFVDETQADAAMLDRDLARRAASATMTLLKNDAGVLPLSSDTKTLLIVGDAANDASRQLGGWSVEWQGLPAGSAVSAVTIVQGIKAAAPSSLRLMFDSGTDATRLQRAARDADAIVAVIGETPYAEGKGDNPSLNLPVDQLEIVRNLRNLGKPVVTVLFAGRPVNLESVLPVSNALLMAYLPGSEGGRAVADALFGARNPSGRLPFSWPKTASQLPATLGTTAQNAPLYPFGTGLSYTTFEAQNPRFTAPLEVSLDVTNTGKRAGTRTVLAWTRDGSRERLVGWASVSLKAGERQTVQITVDAGANGKEVIVEGLNLKR